MTASSMTRRRLIAGAGLLVTLAADRFTVAGLGELFANLGLNQINDRATSDHHHLRRLQERLGDLVPPIPAPAPLKQDE